MALPVFQATVQDGAAVVPSATITVIDESTGLAPVGGIFSDRNGTAVLGTGGVFTTGSDGFAQFYAAPGEYKITASSGAFSLTWRYVVLTGTAARVATGTASGEVPLNSDLGSARLVDTGTASGEVPLNSDGSGIAQLNASNLSSGTVPDARLDIPFTVGYLSSAQTIVSAGLITLAHGLGVVPKLIQLELKCTTAEEGYSIGDRLIPSAISNSDAVDGRTNSIVINTINIEIRVSSRPYAFRVANKSTGDIAALTNANWELYVRAFA